MNVFINATSYSHGYPTRYPLRTSAIIQKPSAEVGT